METIVDIILSRGLPRASMLSILPIRLKASTKSALMQGSDEYDNVTLCWIVWSPCEGLK